MVADDLRRQADNFIELSDIADRIARRFLDQTPPAPRAPRDEDPDVDSYGQSSEAIVTRR